MGAVEPEGESRGFWGKVWERFWWVFALALVGGVAGVYKLFGGVALLKLWASLFAGLGAAVMVYGGRAWRLASRSPEWFPAQARVLRSEVRTERNSSFSRDGINPSYQTVSHYPEVEYEYEVEGEKRRSDRVLLVRVNYSAEEAAATVAKYPTGAAVTAWYDPRDPDRVVLEPGLRGARSKYAIPLLVGLVFMLFGISTWVVLALLGR